MDYMIKIRFYPAGRNISLVKAPNVVFDGVEHKNVKIREQGQFIDYYVSGPSAGSTVLKSADCTNKTFEILTKIIFEKILHLCYDYQKSINQTKVQNDNTVKIVASAHCLVASRMDTCFVNKLKQMLSTMQGLSEKVKIVTLISDPAEPLRKKNESILFENLKKSSDNTQVDQTNVLFYSAGGGFFVNKNSKRDFKNRIINFGPKLVISAQTIYIILCDHNDIMSRVMSYFNYLPDNPTPGIFLLEDVSYFSPTKIDKENLQNTIKKISDYTKGKEKFRIKVLTNVIAVKLKIAQDNLVEYLPEYSDSINRVLVKVSKSINIKSAFNHILNLFEPKGLLFGFVNKEGDFYSALINSREKVVGISSNNYEEAIDILTDEINQTQRPYKKDICQALINRIKKWYKLP